MFEALKEIGEAVLSAGGCEFRIERIKGKGTLLAKVIFNLDNGRLECDCNFRCTGKVAEEYLWIGNARGQKPQLVLTTDNPKYLLDSSNFNKWAIGQIINAFDGKFSDTDVIRLISLLKEINLKFFSAKKSYVEDLDALLGEERKNVALYTACVKKDEKIIDLSKEPGYRKLLYYVTYATGSEEYPVMRGICHICGEEKDVLTNPSYREGTLLSIYNLDKAGFMPHLNRRPEATVKAHAVCVDCKRKLLLGLGFVEQKLTASIGTSTGQPGKLTVFLIPKLLGVQRIHMAPDSIAQKINEAYGAVNAYKSLEDVERRMESVMEFEGTYGCFLNILFGYGESSHFHFQHLIQDVPVMRLLELSHMMARISNEAAELFMEFPEAKDWSIGFEGIFSIFPLSVRKNKVVEWKPLVELFDSLLKGTSYSKGNIVSNAVLFAKIHRYGTYGGYNFRQPPKNAEEGLLCRGLLRYNLLLKLLKEAGVIEMERESISNSFEIPDKNIETFFLKMGYVEWQKALFLLGVLVGKIGIEQYKRGDGKKAVLNKINFEGMPAERVKLLANYVLEGLRNYRVLDDRNEAIYACMKAMLDRNIESLRNPIDNVFYILSGYAYTTLQAIKGGR